MKVAAEVVHRRGTAVALVVVAGLAVAVAVVRLRSCEAPFTSPASLARAGDAVLAAWESRDGDDTTVYVRRFDDPARGLTTVRSGAPVYRGRYISETDPEIVTGPTGALIVVRPRLGDQVAIPLDLGGVPTGVPQRLTGCRDRTSTTFCAQLCRRPVATATGFIVGDLSLTVNGPSSVGLSFLDRSGRTLRHELLSISRPNSCAMTASGDQLVVASGEERPDYSFGIRFQYRSLRDDSPTAETWLLGGERALALLPYEGAEAILYTRNDHLHVALVSARDGVRQVLPLSPSIDWRSADLGLSSRGLFVTWLEDGKAHVLGVGADAKPRTQRAASSPRGTRALGVADRCLAAWTAGGGSKLQLLSGARCP